MNLKNFRLSEEVADALASKEAVVALESTIIAHGMPYPQNVDTARRVEEEVRKCGAVPATIAVINGELCIGLSSDELNSLATAANVMKLSRRDLPWAIAKKCHGATTVAATMIAAKLAGIEVFVTGGIGGVHRGGDSSFDISADLMELAKTSVAVVSAGAKSILDIPATLEYLETLGVPVVGYRTNDFPAFYSRESGNELDLHTDEMDELARFIRMKWDMGLKGGILVANPIPKEYALSSTEIEMAIERALDEAETQGITGKAVTPFLLSRVKQHTAGESLNANIQLVLHNARVGAELAKCLTRPIGAS